MGVDPLKFCPAWGHSRVCSSIDDVWVFLPSEVFVFVFHMNQPQKLQMPFHRIEETISK